MSGRALRRLCCTNGLVAKRRLLDAERGYDAEQVDADIASERDRERRLGLDFRRLGSPAQATGGGVSEWGGSE